MNRIVPMYKLEMMSVLSQQGSEGVQRYQNSHFKFLPISIELGSSNISFFPNSKQSKLSWGGSRKLWTVSTICDIFFMAPLRLLFCPAHWTYLSKSVCMYVCNSVCMFSSSFFKFSYWLKYSPLAVSYSGHCHQQCKSLLSNAILRFLNFAELCPTQIFASGSASDSPLIKL